VLERRAGECEREGVRIVIGAHVIPLEDVQAKLVVPARRRRGERAVGESLRRRMGIGVERRLAQFGIPGPPSHRHLLGVHRVAHDEVV
jgi:hypothetical protein